MKKFLLTVASVICTPLSIVGSYLIMVYLFGLLSYVPVVRVLLKLLFIWRGDSPGILTAIISIGIGWVVNELLCADTVTDGGVNIGKRLSGIALVITALVLFCVVNLSLLAIIYFIAIAALGVYLVVKG